MESGFGEEKHENKYKQNKIMKTWKKSVTIRYGTYPCGVCGRVVGDELCPVCTVRLVVSHKVFRSAMIERNDKLCMPNLCEVKLWKHSGGFFLHYRWLNSGRNVKFLLPW